MHVQGEPVEAVHRDAIAGAVGEVRRDGLVFVNGELWQARAPDGSSLRQGQKVRVGAVDPSLVLDVEPLDPAPT